MQIYIDIYLKKQLHSRYRQIVDRQIVDIDMYIKQFKLNVEILMISQRQKAKYNDFISLN